MKCIKVSIWCLIALVLMTSTAMGEIEVGIHEISGVPQYAYTFGTWHITNLGNTSIYNVSVYVWLDIMDQNDNFSYFIEEIKPMTSYWYTSSAIATNAGTGVWTIGASDENGNNGADRSFFQIHPMPKPPESVPEFPTVAIPAIAIVGLIFLLQRRKGD